MYKKESRTAQSDLMVGLLGLREKSIGSLGLTFLSENDSPARPLQAALIDIGPDRLMPFQTKPGQT